MKYPVTCRACGHENALELSQAGKSVACGGCGAAMKAPAPKEKAGTTAEAPGTLRFACPACGRKFATKAEMAGKKIRCGGCGAGVRVPGGPATPSAPALQAFGATVGGGPSRSAAAVPPPQAAGDDLGLPSSLFDDGDDEESSDPYALAGHDEPEAAEPALPSRAEMLEKARAKAEEQAVEAEEQVKKKKKKKKKKQTGYFNARDTWILVGSVLGVVAVVTAVAWAYPGVRFPIGGVFVVVGFITYLLGAYQLRQRVAEEGFIQVLLWRFFPPYQWWFVFSRWSETKDFVAFFASGLIILALGGAILKTSPIGKKAAESEAAYQRAGGGAAVAVPLSGDSDDEE